MRYGLIPLLLMSVLAARGVTLQVSAPQSAVPPEQAVLPVGRWQVKFNLAGVEKNLILISQAGGVPSFVLLDTGPDDKPVTGPKPATWSQLTDNRLSFSGEVELPIGTCC